MLPCDVSDIHSEIFKIAQRIERSRRDFAAQAERAPYCALSQSESIARDRMHHLHLAMLARGLSTDYDRWAEGSMDQRMEQVGFRRLPSRLPLYLRQNSLHLDISDLFSIIHVDAADVKTLIAGLRSMQL